MSELPIPAELMPRHVAVIMDGNGRWAKKRGMPRAFGHRAGVEALEPIIEACGGWGIEALTLFAFSTENWARPKDEVAALMGLIVEYFNKKIDELDRKGVCIRMLGDLSAVPDLQRETALRAMERTKDNKGLKLNIALNYGGRQEILRAARRLAEKCADGEMRPEQIDEVALHRGAADGGFAHPNQRRRTHLQLPALPVRLCGICIRAGILAGFHARSICPRAGNLCAPRPAFWQSLKNASDLYRDGKIKGKIKC